MQTLRICQFLVKKNNQVIPLKTYQGTEIHILNGKLIKRLSYADSYKCDSRNLPRGFSNKLGHHFASS